MNIAIVDDRKTDSDRLVGFIDTYAEQHRLQWGAMDRFSSGEEFLGAFTAGKYDLIFLDIYMDGITGMETAKRIRRADHGCRIIFITTSPEFAVESYDVSASFYLLKPIEKKKVFPSCAVSPSAPAPPAISSSPQTAATRWIRIFIRVRRLWQPLKRAAGRAESSSCVPPASTVWAEPILRS